MDISYYQVVLKTMQISNELTDANFKTMQISNELTDPDL